MTEATKDGHTPTAPKTRLYVFDNIKAFMIFVVVSTHYLRATEGFTMASLSGATYLTMISCDMVLFLFIAGYFSKNVEKCRQGAVKAFLFPYLVLSVFMYGMRYLIYGHANLHIILPTLALWFLLVMFFYRFLLKDLIRIPYILPLSFLISIVAGLIPPLDSTLALGRTFGFLPIFILGYFCTAEHIKKIRNISKMITVPLFVILIGYSFYMAYAKVLPLNTWFLKSSYLSLGIPNAEGIFVRAWILAVSIGWIIVFINLFPDKKTWYTSIGLETMTVYALHLSFRHLISILHTDFGGGLLSYFVPLALVAITVWLLSRKPVANAYNKVMDSLYFLCSWPFVKLRQKMKQ